ncbi:MAG: glucuronate isomerase [Cyclobacteriaceae bacterium]
MMQPFIHENFLLTNPYSERLYHDYAANLPIIDFHNHLVPKDIAEDRIFGDISKLWLEGDHYKWRAMRASGINEEYITGQGSDWEKFWNWSVTVPKTLRSPLYHWTHLELNRYFGVDKLLNEKSAREIYDHCNAQAATPQFSVKNLLRKMNVEYLCTSEDPTCTLEWHKKIRGDFEIEVGAAFRPDPVLAINNGPLFRNYMEALGDATGLEIDSYKPLCQALENRHEYFHGFGTRLSDIALDWFTFSAISDRDADRIFRKVISGKAISQLECNGFRTTMLTFLCELNDDRGWVQQFHMGALRSVNTRSTADIGAACGFDAMNDVTYVGDVAKLLDSLEMRKKLARSIFFNLNPRDNAAVLTLINSFNDGLVEGKMQYGPPWWFLDQKEGIETQLNDLSSYGVLGNFIGMLTDSRSFLSFPRHEYFRRILCDVLGKDIKAGLIPFDEGLLKATVENICYFNVKRYLCIRNEALVQ